MEGIIYLEDNNTKKKYVQIDLEKIWRFMA